MNINHINIHHTINLTIPPQKTNNKLLRPLDLIHKISQNPEDTLKLILLIESGYLKPEAVNNRKMVTYLKYLTVFVPLITEIAKSSLTNKKEFILQLCNLIGCNINQFDCHQFKSQILYLLKHCPNILKQMHALTNPLSVLIEEQEAFKISPKNVELLSDIKTILSHLDDFQNWQSCFQLYKNNFTEWNIVSINSLDKFINISKQHPEIGLILIEWCILYREQIENKLKNQLNAKEIYRYFTYLASFAVLTNTIKNSNFKDKKELNLQVVAIITKNTYKFDLNQFTKILVNLSHDDNSNILQALYPVIVIMLDIIKNKQNINVTNLTTIRHIIFPISKLQKPQQKRIEYIKLNIFEMLTSELKKVWKEYIFMLPFIDRELLVNKIRPHHPHVFSKEYQKKVQQVIIKLKKITMDKLLDLNTIFEMNQTFTSESKLSITDNLLPDQVVYNIPSNSIESFFTKEEVIDYQNNVDTSAEEKTVPGFFMLNKDYLSGFSSLLNKNPGLIILINNNFKHDHIYTKNYQESLDNGFMQALCIYKDHMQIYDIYQKLLSEFRENLGTAKTIPEQIIAIELFCAQIELSHFFTDANVRTTTVLRNKLYELINFPTNSIPVVINGWSFVVLHFSNTPEGKDAILRLVIESMIFDIENSTIINRREDLNTKLSDIIKYNILIS